MKRFLSVVMFLSVFSGYVEAQKSVGCAYPSKKVGELERVEDCGSLGADWLLHVHTEVISDIAWNKLGLECVFVYNAMEGASGWYYVNQSGIGRIAPFSQDNDCSSFSEGLAVGLSSGKVIFYDQAMNVIKRTDYVWASGFYKGYAKVCRGDLIKEYDETGERYEYKGGKCGFINTSFEEVIALTFSYENTASPEELH